MNPFYFKLVNGDEIMANVIDEDENYYTIDYPYKFLCQQHPVSGYVTTSLMRWVPMQSFMMQPLRVKKSTVITEGRLEDSIVKYYAHVRLQTTKEIEDYDDEQEMMEYVSDEDDMTEDEMEALDELTNPDLDTTVH